MKKLRFGTVGFGPRGRSMTRLAAEFDNVEIVAGCDIRPHNWFKKQWQAPAAMADLFPNATFYENYDEMLEKADLDIVLVETGADIHAEFCAKALEKNINVLTDIPVVANLKEAERLWKAAEKSEAIISIGANPNEQKFTVLLKDFYAKGLLGEPYCMEAEYIHWSFPGSDSNIHYNENGNWRKLLCPIRYCTHSLGPLLTILQEELRKVSCFGTGCRNELAIKGGWPKDDMSCAQFQTDSGVVIRLMRNSYCRADIGHHSYRVFGTQGYMERIDRFGKPVIRYNSQRELDNKLKEIDGSFMPPAYEKDQRAINAGHGGMDFAMMDHFIDAVANSKPAPISLKEGLAMTLPGIYAEESSKRGGEVMRMYYPWDPEWTGEF